jgi:hypothetical protein
MNRGQELHGPSTTGKMHKDEVETSVHLVVKLIAEQFPALSALAVTPANASGTDNTQRANLCATLRRTSRGADC